MSGDDAASSSIGSFETGAVAAGAVSVACGEGPIALTMPKNTPNASALTKTTMTVSRKDIRIARQ